MSRDGTLLDLRPMRQMILDIRPDAPPGFDNFLVGANGEAIVTLHGWVASGAPECALYLWGEPGTGKTHLLRAAESACREQGREVHLLSAGQPLPATLSGLLLVDDVEGLDAAGQVALFNLINQAREGAGHIVASGGAAPATLALREDLRSRLAWGLVFRLLPLSDADKLGALRGRAAARGLELPDEVGRHLITHCRRDLPHLLALVDGLDGFSLSMKRPLTLPLVREFLRDHG